MDKRLTELQVAYQEARNASDKAMNEAIALFEKADLLMPGIAQDLLRDARDRALVVSENWQKALMKGDTK